MPQNKDIKKGNVAVDKDGKSYLYEYSLSAIPGEDEAQMFINKIDNWAICDSFCSSIKIVRKYEEKYFKEAIKMALNKEEFISRVGLIMILNHFISQRNLKTILEILNKISSDKFYINMAEAWLLCEAYIKFPKEIKEYLKENKLNKFTQNKAISKIHDSYRVKREEKELLSNFRK